MTEKPSTNQSQIVDLESFAAAQVEHTFTPSHTFQLWDMLTTLICRCAENMTIGTAQDIARGLMTVEVIELGKLNRLTLAAKSGDIDPRDLCGNASCDGPKQGHVHGKMCGPLCSCGEGE